MPKQPMPYKNLDSGQKHWIKKCLRENPELLQEVILELRQSKINKIIKK